MKQSRHWVETGEGHRLDVSRFVSGPHFRPDLRPVLLIPGYCMNTFILGYHPRGRSLVEFLARAGFAVWTVNLRGQGDTASHPRATPVTFRGMALVDLPAAIREVLAHTPGHSHLDLVGCSLGGTVAFSYLAHVRERAPVGALVGLGAPLEWTVRPALMRFAFGSRRLSGWLAVRNARGWTRHLISWARRIPRPFSGYMNAKRIDLSRPDLITRTIDDPHASLNREIATWVKRRRLYVEGVDVKWALAGLDIPYLAIWANTDGVVPPSVARAVTHVFSGEDDHAVEVGDARNPFAHADLFVNDESEARVFAPLTRWLHERNARSRRFGLVG